MRDVIEALEPKSVWKNFYAINQIPRCSGNETAVGQYVINFAGNLGLKWNKDDVGNIIISKPATPDMEDRPACVIQGHLDMVCEKNKGTEHDFENDPIKMLVEDGWVTADGTTLGSDNGIAVAMGMSLMESSDIPHPPLEFLFTVDEETGLTGANALKNDFVNGRVLLNIDSEEEGTLYIGCAGGRDTNLRKTIDWVEPHDDHKTFILKVEGLRGGHSGLDISVGLGNAIKLLGRVLYNLKDMFHYHISGIEGGSKHNAIPREAEAIIDIPADRVDELKKAAEKFAGIFQTELKIVDPKVTVTVETTEKSKKVFSTPYRDALIGLLHAIPHGVQAMSQAIEGLVETSTNMATIKTTDDAVELLTSQRSSVESSIDDIADKVQAVGELAGFEVKQGNGYPAWQPNTDSELLKTCKKIYADRKGNEPEVKAIHAGLECGIIGEKYDGMDMISFGPDIEGAHSPDEKIRIESVNNIWNYLLDILKNIE